MRNYTDRSLRKLYIHYNSQKNRTIRPGALNTAPYKREAKSTGQLWTAWFSLQKQKQKEKNITTEARQNEIFALVYCRGI